jgi:hypothetical protein
MVVDAVDSRDERDGRGAEPAPRDRTLRDALQGHPAGPEVAAALGPLADRPAPAGWDRWTPAAREGYLDRALDEARAGTSGGPAASGAGGGASPSRGRVA